MKLPVFLIIFILLLGIVAFRYWQYQEAIIPYQDGEEITFTTTLLTEPIRRGQQQRFSVYPERRGRITIYAPSFPSFSYGQQLQISGTISETVLENEQALYAIYSPAIEARDQSALEWLGMMRKNLIIIFSRTLPPASSGLLLGIVFGIRSAMPEDLYKALVDTGVIHITAASGMNVTMVAGAIFALTAGFLRRQWAILLSITIVWLYALFGGLEPSILRAATMATVAFSASLLGRQNTAALTLFTTALLLLIHSPRLLVDVGFQLSFFATLGIILLNPLFGLSNRFDPTKKIDGILQFAFKDDIVTTISAQIATLPLLVYYFGRFNLLSLIANALILWTIPLLMILGALGSLFGLVWQPLGSFFLLLSLPLLLLIEHVVMFFADHQVSFELEHLSILVIVGYYVLLSAVLLMLRSRKSEIRSTKSETISKFK